MSQDTQPEDRTILAAIEALERGGDALEPGADADETAETLARLYAEVLGLIAYELDPVAPPPEVKQRLMAAIAGEASPQAPQAQTEQAVPRPAPVPTPAREAAAVPPPAPSVRPSQEVPAASPAPPTSRVPLRPPAVSRPPRRWPVLLAASLALIFAGSSAWLYDQWITEQTKTTQLGQLLEEERRRGLQGNEPVEDLRAQLASLREKLNMVTTPAVEVSPLRPEGRLQPQARGLLFVAADHKHWYLNVEGLQPADADKVYQLWWMAPEGPVSGGTFIARPGERIELSSETMPAGTTAAVVTLENAGGAPAPTGPAVLRSTGIRQLS